jgi:hypothetical protein
VPTCPGEQIIDGGVNSQRDVTVIKTLSRRERSPRTGIGSRLLLAQILGRLGDALCNVKFT